MIYEAISTQSHVIGPTYVLTKMRRFPVNPTRPSWFVIKMTHFKQRPLVPKHINKYISRWCVWTYCFRWAGPISSKHSNKGAFQQLIAQISNKCDFADDLRTVSPASFVLLNLIPISEYLLAKTKIYYRNESWTRIQLTFTCWCL